MYEKYQAFVKHYWLIPDLGNATFFVVFISLTSFAKLVRKHNAGLA